MSSPTTKPSEEAAPKAKSKKKLIIIIAAAVLLLGGGGGGYLMLSGGKSSTATPAKPEVKPGKVAVLEAITINLAGGHYLKIGIALQGIEGVAETGVPDASRVADLAISEFTDRDLAELSSEQGRVKLKAELLTKIQEAYPDSVMALYFTQFVIG